MTIKNIVNKVFLSFGANIGNRRKNIELAFELIQKNDGKIIQTSHFYESTPLGFDSAHLFLNCCVELETYLNPQELILQLLEIESALKRQRFDPNRGYVDRTIDIDIIFYNDVIVERPLLTIPHPRMQERLFVLKPLSEICPDFVHPVLKKTIAELLAECADVSKVELTLGL